MNRPNSNIKLFGQNNLEVISTSHHTCLDGYNISSLVEYFGNITRYGANFHPVVNVSLLFNRDQYVQSMSMYGVMAVIGLVIATILLLLFFSFNMMLRSALKFSLNSKKSIGWFNYSCSLLLVLFAIVGAISFCIGFVSEIHFHKAGDNICQTLDLIYDRLYSIQNGSG